MKNKICKNKYKFEYLYGFFGKTFIAIFAVAIFLGIATLFHVTDNLLRTANDESYFDMLKSQVEDQEANDIIIVID